MKAYEIQIMTQSGVKTLLYNESQPLAQFEARVKDEYGDFITIKSTELLGVELDVIERLQFYQNKIERLEEEKKEILHALIILRNDCEVELGYNKLSQKTMAMALSLDVIKQHKTTE